MDTPVLPRRHAAALLDYVQARTTELEAEIKAAMEVDRVDHALRLCGEARGIQKLAIAIGNAATGKI